MKSTSFIPTQEEFQITKVKMCPAEGFNHFVLTRYFTLFSGI